MIRTLRRRTSIGSSFFVEWTCSEMKPVGVMESFKSAAGTPLMNVLIESPLHSMRYLFHSFCLNAFRASLLSFKSLSQPRRPSS